MTTDSFFLRFQWGPRNEGIECCTRRLNEFILELAYIDPAFNVWRRTCPDDSGRMETLLGQRQLAQWLSEGARRTGDGERPLPGLGFSVTLIAEQLAEPMRVNCGGYSASASNGCTIEFARDTDASERVLRAAVLGEVARAAIRVWQPDHGVVTSHECSRKLSPACSRSEAGWLTYLSRAYDPIEPVPGHVEALESGRLVLATLGRFSSLRPDHMRFVEELSQLMEPLVPEPRRRPSHRYAGRPEAESGPGSAGAERPPGEGGARAKISAGDKNRLR